VRERCAHQEKEPLMSENTARDVGSTPPRPDLDQDIPGGIDDRPDDDIDLPGERLDEDFDVATAREQAHYSSRHPDPDPSGSLDGDAEVVDGS
jgi:hypothetical protein